MSSVFEFVQGNERLDWGVLVSIDVHRLMKDTNVDTLQRIVENLAFSRITRDEAAMFTPDHVLQLFQLSQLVIQYLVYSQECLARMNLKLNERLEDLQGAQHQGEDARRNLEEENASLRKEVKAQRRTLLAYEYNAASGARPTLNGLDADRGAFVCQLCGEAYHKQESLQSHMRKRHYGVPAPPPPAAYPPSVPPPLPQAPGAAAGGDDWSRVNARVQQLETKLERDRDAMDRQRDQMLLLLLAKSGQTQGIPYNAGQTPPPPPPPQPVPSSSSQPQTPVPTVTPAFQSPIRSVGDSLLPSAIAAIPIVPDTAAMMEYNHSKQREVTDNALARQIVNLEKEIRDLRGGGAPSADATVPPPPPPPPQQPGEVPPPAPVIGATPSWLSSLGLPGVPTSTPIPLPNAGVANTTATNPPPAAPTVLGVGAQGGAGAVPSSTVPLPLPALGATSSSASPEAQRQQELANYLKYGPTGPAFLPPPPSSIVPNPNTPLPPPQSSQAPVIPVPALNVTNTPNERTHHRRSSRSSSYSYSYSSSSRSSSSSDSILARAYRPGAPTTHKTRHSSSHRRHHRSRTGSPPAAPAPAQPPLPVLSLTGPLSVPLPIPVTAYESQNAAQGATDAKDKKEKRDKKDKKSRHHAKDTPDAPISTVLRPPTLEAPLPSGPSATTTSSAPMSYAAMLQQYQDQLLKPATVAPIPVPTLSAHTPLQMSTVGSPPLPAPTAATAATSHLSVPSAAAPVPLPVPGVGYNYGVSQPLPTTSTQNTYNTSTTLTPPSSAPRSNVPEWLRTQDGRPSSSGSSSSTSTVPPNRISGTGPSLGAGAPPVVPSLTLSSPSMATANTISVPSAYTSQSQSPAPSNAYSAYTSGPLSVPSAGAVPVPLPQPGGVSAIPTVPSPYATSAYMTGVPSSAISSSSQPVPVPLPTTTTGVSPIPVPSPYYSTAAPLPGQSVAQVGSNVTPDMKTFRPRVSSSDSSSSGYTY